MDLQQVAETAAKAPEQAQRGCHEQGPAARSCHREATGGLSVVDVSSREETLAWAAKIAVACRCAQEVREFLPDPEQDAMHREADRRQ